MTNFIFFRKVKMTKQQLEKMHEFARNNDIPIIEDSGAKLLIELVEHYQPSRILEIGTAIGYSALLMHDISGAEVVSIERDEYRYNLAKGFIDPLDVNIQLFCDDALLFDDTKLGKFDMIYFDAAKAQNINFFNKYQHHLNVGGIIVVDNLLFHGLTFKQPEAIKSRNMRQLTRKLRNFIDFANNQPGYKFILLEEGDGLGIMIKEQDVEI